MNYNDRQESDKRPQPIRPRAPGPNLFVELLESPARQAVVGFTLVIALLAFEIFNFDTTRFALTNLMGEVSFFGISWATILAVAFCAIDFAGLAHMFTPERGTNEPREVWYLTGAWLLGASMNAVMTWWAVSLTLLNHTFGNEVLSREILLQYVPIFVAVLVWLTRILFIGAVATAGERLFERTGQPVAAPQRARPAPKRPVAPGSGLNRPVPRPMSAAPRTVGDGTGRPTAPLRAAPPTRRR
ncbi:MAG: hypothetical protein KDE59_23115 [Anaerolineales bacterium]|nr:hypothetical protein [Anaerolineales bacterium]